MIKNKILIVDDDELNTIILNSKLKDLYELKIAHDGKTALKILENAEIDLILLDIEMPEMNGFDVANEIMKNEKTKNIPFIFLTARDDEYSFEKGFDLGAKDFILKPFKQKELEVRIKNHITNYLQKKAIKKQEREILAKENLINDYLIYSETNLSGIITNVSKSFCELSEYTKEELIGKPHNIVRHPDMKSEVFKDLWQTVQNKKTWVGEVKNKTKNGHYYWVYATVSPKYDEENNHIGYISLRQEITAKKEYETQQKRLNEESRILGLKELISNISHHWRQPLSVITTISSGIQIENEFGTLDLDKLNEQLALVNDSAFYLSNTIDKFSTFMNSDDTFTKISIKEEIDTVLTLIDSILVNSSIKVTRNFANKTDINIITIKKELTQVLINILTNAKDALEKNSIDNRNILIDYEVSNNKVIITIEDNGTGIKEEHLSQIFDPYFTTKHKSQGKGLSLYSSYTAVTQLLKGSLYVENTGDGAKFFIELSLV